MFGLEVEVDSGIGGEDLLAEAGVDARQGVAQRRNAALARTHPLINYYHPNATDPQNQPRPQPLPSLSHPPSPRNARRARCFYKILRAGKVGEMGVEYESCGLSE